MTATPDLFGHANERPDQAVGKSGTRGGKAAPWGDYQRRLHDTLRRLWPFKATSHLTIIAEVSARQAERIVSREQRISGDVLIGLLWSAHGYEFLRAAMEGCQAVWWQEVHRERELTKIKRERRELERRLKKLDEDV